MHQPSIKWLAIVDAMKSGDIVEQSLTQHKIGMKTINE